MSKHMLARRGCQSLPDCLETKRDASFGPVQNRDAMPVVNISEARSSLCRLVASVESGAETEIIIARNGRPAARLMAIKPPQIGKRIGVAKGKFIVPVSIDANEAAIAALFCNSAA